MKHFWKIINLERKIINGRVTNASFSCESTHNGYGERKSGEIPLPYLAPSSSKFIPYENLTNDIVAAWVTGSIDHESYELSNSSSIASRINADNDKTEEEGLPW
tara:strand:+ start:485 stop:796 length:312 start_codon:yes stop_codon:yes gene_type:complete